MDITEVFIVEKRMMDLTFPIEIKDIIDKTCSDKPKKLNIHQNKTNEKLQLLTVRGLN